MGIEETCALSVRHAKRKFGKLATVVLDGDVYMERAISYDPRGPLDGLALSGWLDVVDAFRTCEQLADYLHEYQGVWRMWASIRRAFGYLRERWGYVAKD